MARHSRGQFLPVVRLEGIVVTEAGDEVLVYDTERHHIHHLNQTTAVVWRLCDGQHDAGQIASLASDELGATIDVTAVHAALALLGEANLLRDPLPDGMSKVSRRWLVKRAAVAGVAAAPLIASTQAARAGSHHSCRGSNRYASGCHSHSSSHGYGSNRGSFQGSSSIQSASLDDSMSVASSTTSVAGSPCEPGKGQCVVEPYDAWVCYPSSATTGYCGAMDGSPSIGTAIAVEQQMLADGGHLVQEESEAQVTTDNAAAGDQPNGMQDPPVEDPPAEDPPAEDPPAEDPPVEDPPAEDPPADVPPAEGPPVDSEDAPEEDPAESTGG